MNTLIKKFIKPELKLSNKCLHSFLKLTNNNIKCFCSNKNSNNNNSNNKFNVNNSNNLLNLIKNTENTIKINDKRTSNLDINDVYKNLDIQNNIIRKEELEFKSNYLKIAIKLKEELNFNSLAKKNFLNPYNKNSNNNNNNNLPLKSNTPKELSNNKLNNITNIVEKHISKFKNYKQELNNNKFNNKFKNTNRINNKDQLNEAIDYINKNKFDDIISNPSFVNIDLNLLSKLKKPLLIYEVNSKTYKFNYYSTILLRLITISSLIVNMKVYFTYNLLFKNNTLAYASCYFLNTYLFTGVEILKILKKNIVLSFKIDSSSRSVILEYYKNIYSNYSKIIVLPINKIEFDFDTNQSSYIFKVNIKKLGNNNIFKLEKQGIFYQENLLFDLFNYKK